MDKETLLQTYIDIETKTFVRADKTKRLEEFINNIKANKTALNLQDTLDIVHNLQQSGITIRQPLFLHVIYPVLTTGINSNNIDAIKSLLGLFEYFGNYEDLMNDKRFSNWTLLTKGLELAPNDNELLNMYERKQKDYFEYTLHELPTGVLYGSDGATIEQCNELLHDINDYEEVCSKLEIDEHELIEECKFYYSAYKNYLLSYKDFNGFGDYLAKNKNA